MYQQNSELKKDIDQFGETYNLPLFGGEAQTAVVQNKTGIKIPEWIWSGNGIKAEVYNLLKDKFAENSCEYLAAVVALGGSATDHEVKSYFNDDDRWPLSIVSARRNYFKDSPFYIITSYPGKQKMGPKKVPNTIWYIDFNNLKLILEHSHQKER